MSFERIGCVLDVWHQRGSALSRRLGDLRRDLQPEVLGKVVAEIDKDLTKIPTHDVLSHIDDVLVG